MADQNGRIRKRQSYRMWLGVSKFLNGKPRKREIMGFMHGLLNGASAYGSMTNAGYSKESLELVLQDTATPADLDIEAAAVKVGESYSGDELVEALGADMHNGLYAVGNDKIIVVGEDEGNDNYKILSVVAR
jgi:hypothetical protein